MLTHPLPLLSLMVEPPKGSLSVEHLKVLSSPSPLDGGLISRAPKGPLLNSRACYRILMVEHLKVLISRVTNVPGHGGS